METKDTIWVTAILLLIGGYAIVSNIDPTHYSDSLQEKRYCDRLSSTNKTCYPTPLTTIGKKYASDGWKEIPFMPEDIPEPRTSTHNAQREICTPYGRKGI